MEDAANGVALNTIYLDRSKQPIIIGPFDFLSPIFDLIQLQNDFGKHQATFSPSEISDYGYLLYILLLLFFSPDIVVFKEEEGNKTGILMGQILGIPSIQLPLLLKAEDVSSQASLSTSLSSGSLEIMTDTFEFIIVGTGTSGCLLANRLANAHTRPSVLPAEAGGSPEGDVLRAPFNRFRNAYTRPDLDHGYSIIPQTALNNLEDYHRWANLVGDETWKWEYAKELNKRVENYAIGPSDAIPEYANPNRSAHGQSGMVYIYLPSILEKGTTEVLDAMVDYGFPRNLDANSGNAIGVGISLALTPRRSYDECNCESIEIARRSYNLDRFKSCSLGFEWQKIPWHRDSERPQSIIQKNDVILGARALDAPKLLLMSGIGPAAELRPHGIEIIHVLPGACFREQRGRNICNQQSWIKDQTGPMAYHGGTLWGGVFKLPGMEETSEFKGLKKDLQEYLP
ncbi:GMC oxidoreductase [Lepidopterella palustris CBS 459.81]|uniref:GMC oxidoreductase n=1 Tax=Lepidopterella palustris CBS 459.81 TaxID=1314670 RepID=A0A8E2JB14_9PEZI|nr:GMC oxidoreductase [Lepidopterella palustris CBS 459.81]